MSTSRGLLGHLLPALLLLGTAQTDAVTVCPSGCDFDKIRTAVNSGAALIEVLPGTYPASEDSVQLEGQALVGLGADPSQVMVIGDCVFGGLSVLRVASDPTPSVIRNLSLAQPVGCNFDNGIRVASPANGLYSIRARWYSSSDRRFLSRDPQPARHPLASSPYQYGYGDPLRWVDVDGRELEKALERLLEKHSSLRVVIDRLDVLEAFLLVGLDDLSSYPSDSWARTKHHEAVMDALSRMTQDFAYELAYLDINFAFDFSPLSIGGPGRREEGLRSTYRDGLAKLRLVLGLARQAINAPPSPAPKPSAPASPPEEKPSGMDAFLDEVDRERGERDQSEGDLEWNVRERDYVTLPNGDRYYLPDEVYDPDGPASIYNLPPWQVVAPLMLQESVREKSQLRPAQGGED